MEMTTRTLPSRKRIALVAHDHRKQALLEWVSSNKPQLSEHQLYATGTTGNLIHSATDPGPLHAERPHGRGSAGRRTDRRRQNRHAGVLWDPLNAVPHDPDVKALRLATVWNIPVANNRATADFLISSPMFATEMRIAIPDYQRYLNERLI